MSFNENTRVKIPANLHLFRLGYDYLPLSAMSRDEGTNIFTDLFSESIGLINPDLDRITGGLNMDKKVMISGKRW